MRRKVGALLSKPRGLNSNESLGQKGRRVDV